MTLQELAQKLQALAENGVQVDMVKENDAEYITVNGHGDSITIGFNEDITKYAKKLGLLG